MLQIRNAIAMIPSAATLLLLPLAVSAFAGVWVGRAAIPSGSGWAKQAALVQCVINSMTYVHLAYILRP